MPHVWYTYVLQCTRFKDQKKILLFNFEEKSTTTIIITKTKAIMTRISHRLSKSIHTKPNSIPYFMHRLDFDQLIWCFVHDQRNNSRIVSLESGV